MTARVLLLTGSAGSLAALWKIHRKNGTTHPRVIEDRAEVDRYLAAVPGADITICRLAAVQAARA